ncbi:heterokaryon incompatibility protein-domain-containing protein [Ustulina deusta]|nr:heterokaryon incompatibility protein-domain-containing protein [Ustulina deusta]
METYTYTPLNLGEPSFRLVRLFGGVGQQLQCELVHASLAPGDVIDYEAVSYTWGVVTHGLYCIEILHEEEMKKLSIGYNLYRLLLSLRRPGEDRMLWIDAICINQDENDTTERNHQVQQMSEIYRAAHRVVVWLGPSTHEMDLAMMRLHELQDSQKDGKSPADKKQVSVWKGFQSSHIRDHNNPAFLGLQQIFDHPWFRRIWVLQEVGNARAALIHCGGKAVSSAIFSVAPSAFDVEIDSHCQAVLDLMPGSPARLQKGSPHRDLRTLLRLFREAQAIREHDHIYALLGLCSEEGKGLRVSYEKPISTIISEVISHVCHYDVTNTPSPLYSSISHFQSHLDNLDENVLLKLVQDGSMHNLWCVFSRQDVYVNLTERIMIAAARRPEGSRQIFDLFIRRVGRLAITKDVVRAAISNRSQGREILDIILPQAAKSVITQAMVMAAISNKHQGRKIFDIILPRAEKSVITQDVVLAAISNERQGREILAIILPRAEKSVITQEVVLAAIKNLRQGREILDVILPRAEISVITQDVVLAAISNEHQGRQILDITLLRAEKSVITQEVVLAAIKNLRQSRQILDILRRARKSTLTEEVILTIMEYSGQHREYLDVVLQRANTIEITTKVVVAAVRNEDQNGELLDIILQRAEESLIDIEQVVRTAVRETNSRECLAIIFRRVKKIFITGALMENALFLDQCRSYDEPIGGCLSGYLLQQRQHIRITRRTILDLKELSDRRLYTYNAAIGKATSGGSYLWKERPWRNVSRCSEANLLQFLLDHGLGIQFESESARMIHQALEQSNQDFNEPERAVAKRRKTEAKVGNVVREKTEHTCHVEFTPTSGAGVYGDVVLEVILGLPIEYYVDFPSGAADLWFYVVSLNADDWRRGYLFGRTNAKTAGGVNFSNMDQ